MSHHHQQGFPVTPEVCASLVTAILVWWLASAGWPSAGVAGPADGRRAGDHVVGVTVTDTAGLGQTIRALRHIGVPVTTRLVLDPGGLARYRNPARRLARAGRVMAEPVDSYSLSRIGLRRYRDRFRRAVGTLGRWAGTWEVGNEVNGSWTGPRRKVAAKVRAAIRVVRARRGRTALTLYYNRGCRSFPSELDPFSWSRRLLTPRIRGRLDFVYLSYYETECENRRPSRAEWRRSFRRLHRLYPGARLGFGEVGLPEPVTPATEAKARSIVNHYYRLRIGLPRFIGGGFYWNFVQDMVPWRNSPLHRTLRRAVR